jgi:hypothetical protein
LTAKLASPMDGSFVLSEPDATPRGSAHESDRATVLFDHSWARTTLTTKRFSFDATPEPSRPDDR